MHNSSLNGRTAARKAYSSASTAQTNTLPHFENGFVIHQTLSPSDQVRILAVVDETGSAPLGDILAVLEGHPEPVEAVTALVHAGTLEFGQHQLVDVNTLVFRRCENPNPIGQRTHHGTPTAPVANGPVADIEQENAKCSFFALDTLELRAQVHVTTDRRLRGVGVNRQLEQAGVYIKIFGDIAYVGCGSRVKSRLNVAPNGLNRKPDEIFVITDANNRLTVDDAYILERILWDRMKAAGHNLMTQDTPDAGMLATIAMSRSRSLPLRPS
ncbi:hypothetical protein JHC09_11105 [Devosia sp. MC532]|uniref:hypothetical protein n=1 Tax=Devosia sp. MC532 TaxID=2799788 RepID=UPI0018F7990E|nr:hypothetical protein [Devosia sp. MC532]MBJ7578429.1 hypothetical protein [Devosia sp. MC532]